MRAWQGAIGASSLRGIVSPAYVVMRPREATSATYFHALFRTPMFAKEAERWSYGITSDMWSLRPEHFKMIYSVVPPLEERIAITRFLGHADKQIGHYIRAKQNLIKLLDEEKKAIINHAVVRGLKPNVEFKPSRASWIGDIPAHWDVVPLKWLVAKGTSITYGIVQAGPDIEGGIPYIRTSDMKSDGLAQAGYLRTSPAIDSAYRVEKKAAIKIQLPDQGAEIEPVPADAHGGRKEPELDRPSSILKAFNDQFGNIKWTDSDRIRKLVTEEIPSKVSADKAYRNAKKNSDRQNARIEHDKALKRVMTAVLKDDAELYKQFSDNSDFRRWLTDMVFSMTYEERPG